MDKKKKIIIIAAAIIVVAAIAVIAAVSGGKKGVKPEETQQTQTVDETGKTADESKNEQAGETPAAYGTQKADEQKADEQKSDTSKSDTKKADEKKSEEKTSDNTMTKEEKEELASYTNNLPTFMYFMSSKDTGYADEKATVEKLQGEYDGRVTFMVKEVDGSEDTYKDLLGALETPALVMLDKDGNSTAILPSATDYNTLKAEIEKTLN